MSRKCRLWWPQEISTSSMESTTNNNSKMLFGWFVTCSPSSLDVVVAFAYNQSLLFPPHASQSALLEATNNTHREMPTTLQDKCSFTVLGCLLTPEHSKEQTSTLNDHNCSFGTCGKWTRSFHSSTWIQLMYHSERYSEGGIRWVPSLHHLHWNGESMFEAELQVIVYETPRFGSHHFLVNACNPKHTINPTKRPKWVDKLYQKPQHTDLNTVMVAINSSAAANTCFHRHFESQTSCRHLSSMCLNFIWRLSAAVVASYFTFLYIVLQLLHKLAMCGSKFMSFITLEYIFSSTWKNIQLRCYQILYWPFFLQETGLRSRTCVEYAEKTALRRHSFWSSVAVDIVLGNLVGIPLLIHAGPTCEWISTLAHNFTDDVLRTGCVWLMGVPAGFKLNTELAGVLGLISLNAIQIWSTLWSSSLYLFYYVIKLGALSGILLGMTITAAFCVDMIAIAAFHVSALHRFTSILYSIQIQALTALWRLFRGRKWNPLRQRLDSFEYSVEQHIVGSLLFTLLLLLLPTISVFHMFFTIINSTIFSLRILIDIIVSVIHATPYTKIILWLSRSRRFPSGIWFDIMQSQNVSVMNGNYSPYKNSLHDQNCDARTSGRLHLYLRSNVMTLGQVVSPHYQKIINKVHGPTIASAFSGVLMGKSISGKLGSELPPKTPWLCIPCRAYWYICYEAVLGCMQS